MSLPVMVWVSQIMEQSIISILHLRELHHQGIIEAIGFILRKWLNNYSGCQLLTASDKYVMTPSVSLTIWKLK